MNPFAIQLLSIIFIVWFVSTLVFFISVSGRLRMIYNQLRIITEFLSKADRERGGHPHGYLEKYKKDKDKRII